jgi:hypothetical protein
MRRLAVLAVCLLACVPALAVAHAAGGKGTVSRSWISTTSGGTSEKSFSVKKVKRLYANFVWKTPATAGQVLRIEWRDPNNALRAVWKDKTIKADKKGTRLYAWIGTGVVKGQPGSWNAVLTVGGTRISAHKFRVVA